MCADWIIIWDQYLSKHGLWLKYERTDDTTNNTGNPEGNVEAAGRKELSQ